MAEPALRHRGQGQEDPSAAAPRVPETLPVWEGPKPPAAERKALLHRIVTAKWLQRTVGGILLFILAFSFWISQVFQI